MPKNIAATTTWPDPKSLRHGLNLMTNVGKVLGEAFGLVPFLPAASGLMQILSSLGSVAARMPLVDAGIGLIPGVAAMSRIVNNAELNALNHGAAIAREDYFAVFSTIQHVQDRRRGLKVLAAVQQAEGRGLAADYLVVRAGQ